MKLIATALFLTTCLTSISTVQAANDDLAISKKSRRLQAVQAKPVTKNLKARKKLKSTNDTSRMSQFRRYYRAAVRGAYDTGSKYYISSTLGALQDPTTLDGGRNLSRIIKPLLNLGNMSAELMQFMGYAGFPNPLPTIAAGVNDLAGLDSRVSVLEKTQHVSSAITLALGPINDSLSAQQTMISNLNARTIVLEDEFYVPLNARTTAMQNTVEALGDHNDAAHLNQIVRGSTPNGIMLSGNMANSLNVIFSKYGWSGTSVASDSYLTQLQATFLIDNIFSNSTITPTTVEETQAWGVLIASMFKTGKLTQEQRRFLGSAVYYAENKYTGNFNPGETRVVSAELANAFNQLAPSLGIVAGELLSTSKVSEISAIFVKDFQITQTNLDAVKTIALASSIQNVDFSDSQKNALKGFYKSTKFNDSRALSLNTLADDQEFLHALANGQELSSFYATSKLLSNDDGSAGGGSLLADRGEINDVLQGGNVHINGGSVRPKDRSKPCRSGVSYLHAGHILNQNGENIAAGGYFSANGAEIFTSGLIRGGSARIDGGEVRNEEGVTAWGGTLRANPSRIAANSTTTSGSVELWGGSMVNQSNQTAWGAYMLLDPGSFVAGQPTRGNALIQGNRVTISSDAGELSLLGSTFSTKNLQVLRALLTVLSGLSAGNHTINIDGNSLIFAVP